MKSLRALWMTFRAWRLWAGGNITEREFRLRLNAARALIGREPLSLDREN